MLTAIATGVYAVSASIWMPGVVTRNHDQFGIFGIALALVTWFSGAALCVVLGACAGAVVATDDGPLGRLVRGSKQSLLVDGAVPSLPVAAGDAVEAQRQADVAAGLADRARVAGAHGEAAAHVLRGLRIRGGASRDPSFRKHSFRVFFRKEYGNGKLPKYGTLWCILYPNVMLEWYPYSLVVSTLLPLAPDQSKSPSKPSNTQSPNPA